MAPPRSSRNLGPQLKQFARSAVALACCTSLVAASSAVAQLNRNNTNAMTNSPYGSPLDPYSASSGQNSQQSQYGTSSNDSTRIEPAQVGFGQSTPVYDGSDTRMGVTLDGQRRLQQSNDEDGIEPTIKRPAAPNEYEKFVERTTGRKLPRFGADLVIPSTRDFAMPAVTTIPPSYVLNPGDQLLIGLSGSIDGTVEVEINPDGEIFLPKVGPVKLAGVNYGSLKGVLTRALGTQYRDFRISVSLAKLRGVRVYVTGFANNPGAYTVNSLSTMVNAILAAGGPAAGGSFRTIKLYRNGELISDFDFYDFIRGGDKSKDVILQNQDVLYIAPVGAQVAIVGSVNQEAVYEARPGETMSELVRYAGGTSVLGDTSRVILYRLENRDRTGGVEVASDALGTTLVTPGDIVQVLSSGSLIQPLARQSVVVRIEGEVNRPGNYYVSPDTSLGQVMELAGGLTPKAFVYGTNFQRVSVRQQQQESFDEAIKQFEVSLAAAPLTKDSSIDQTSSATQLASARSVLDRLRKAEPDGRVVLDIPASAASLPGNLILENNDRIYVPARPTTVGVFGAVYRPASFLINDGKPKKVATYLDMAGGAIRAGDQGQTFVVRANGAVISKKRGALGAYVYPGDVIFVPVKTQSGTVWSKIQQISTVLFQLGLTTAAFVALSK